MLTPDIRIKGNPNESLIIAISKMNDFETVREASAALNNTEVRAVLNERNALEAMILKKLD